VPVSVEDMNCLISEPKASALFHWLREDAGPNLWWVCRSKDGGQGVGLATVTKKECSEVSSSPKEAIRAEKKKAGVGSCTGV